MSSNTSRYIETASSILEAKIRNEVVWVLIRILNETYENEAAKILAQKDWDISSKMELLYKNVKIRANRDEMWLCNSQCSHMNLYALEGISDILMYIREGDQINFHWNEQYGSWEKTSQIGENG